MRPDSAAKALVLRLSKRDRLFVLEGLSWIVDNYNLWQTKHQLPNRRIDRIWAPNVNSGIYQQLHMDQILFLHARILSLGSGGRLRVQAATDVSACILAVRIAVKRHKHGHTRLSVSRIDTSSKRLLRRLEALRKRAKRADIRQMGLLSYRQAVDGWQGFVRWLRYHFLDCGCSLRRRKPPARRRRVSIAQLSKWARAELVRRRKRVPGEADLRKMVRLAVRYIRRGRTGFVVLDLLRNPRFAGEHLADFVTARLEKSKRAQSQVR